MDLENGNTVCVNKSISTKGKVFLLVCADRGSTKLTPAEAREVAHRLENAALEAEKEIKDQNPCPNVDSCPPGLVVSVEVFRSNLKERTIRGS